MLQQIIYSFPFILIRIGVSLLEGLTLYFGTLIFFNWFTGFMAGYVDGLFLLMVKPMGAIMGLALSAVIVKYVLGFIQYYIKLAHIVYLTTLILEYKPFKGSRLLYAFTEATTNFASLALNDVTTKNIVRALSALKDTILKNDLLSRFTETDNTALKFVKSLTATSLKNVIDMTDEIIVSYTWFTLDLYVRDRKRQGKKKPSLKNKIKNQAIFMLESIVFTVRVLPVMMINSVLFEAAFFILANAAIIFTIVTLIGLVPFKWTIVLLSVVLYRTLLSIFYYAIIHSIRLAVYLSAFYSALGDLEPININEKVGVMLGSVPLLKYLVKTSGQDIQPTGSEGSGILEGDVREILVASVGGIAQSFSIDPEVIIPREELQAVDISAEMQASAQPQPQVQPTPSSTQPQQETQPVAEDPVVEINESEIEIEISIDDSPFNDAPEVNRNGR